MAHGCVPVVVSDDFQAPLDRREELFEAFNFETQTHDRTDLAPPGSHQETSVDAVESLRLLVAGLRLW